MKTICFYFQVHLPMQLKRYRFFEIGSDHYYYDDFANEANVQRIANSSFLPANRLILDMIRSSHGKFKVSFSISGIALELFEQYAPEVIDSFKELAETGSVEFVAETYSHSLAAVFDPEEFVQQVKMHSDTIYELFGVRPTTFRNTEMIYSDEIAQMVYEMGYSTMLTEGSKHVLGWKSPNFVYGHSYIPQVKVLTRNMKLSDDIAYRFSDWSWSEFPLTAEKLMSWIKSAEESEKVFSIFMGYQSIGERQRPESGIFEFIKALPLQALANKITFSTPAEIAKKFNPISPISVPYPQTWSGEEKDLSSWTGNDLQTEALQKLYQVGERVRLCSDRALKRDWLCLQSSDHFHYMTTKPWTGFTVYPNYESPYDAFTNYMNVLADFMDRVKGQFPSSIENEELNALLTTINNQESKINELEKKLLSTSPAD
ncbi:glycoside hydrolase family 57 protein [Paludibacter sp.]|uniref:glycoside hydrolase family 57 protein n=1 Tax=Paludibacter sp. TaxID=1898105 RepID=UPI00135565CB|nr:glycoside hydrolase family 57 protein [Paludibacter sp.]MTK51902.1 polysaccharide deacetylase family protein [Paludibacter sp.]